MTSIFQKTINSIYLDIQRHPGWVGHVSGLYAEKLLRDKKTPYLYVLRSGEIDSSYYVTFVKSDLTIKHQPFEITDTLEGWSYENSGSGGPYKDASIDDVLHLIMHCEQHECTPYC